MPVTITFAANPELNIDHYVIYRSDTGAAGPYSDIGHVNHVPNMTLSFVDNTGSGSNYYKLSAVDTGTIESLATGAFLPLSSANLTRLYDIVLDPSQKPVAGLKIEARLTVPQARFQGVVVPATVIAYTDASGFWFMDLYPNSLLEPVGSTYLITIQNSTPGKEVTVPVAVTAEYSTLIVLP